MTPREPEHVLDEISREQLPNDLNLMPGIAAKIQQGNPTMNPAWKLRFLAPFLLVVILLMALLSLPGVASALRGLMGYIPGVGPVDQSVPLRVLAGPVTDERDGYTLTIESAVLDSNRTVLSYSISGQFPSWDDPMLRPTMCQESPSLRLPDGTMLNYPSRVGSGYPGGAVVNWQDVYPAVPAGMNSAVLVLPCLPDLPAGEGPVDWEIPLAFAPAPPDMTVFPVVQPVTAEPAAQPTAELPAQQPPAETGPQGTVTAPSPEGWQWTLEGMAALDEGYYLETVLRWEQNPSFYEVEITQEALHLFDANGQEASVWIADLTTTMAQAEVGSLALNLQTQPIAAPGPARLVIDYVAVHTSPFVTFTIDLGRDPQPGKVWQVNKDIEIDGRTLRVVLAEYVQVSPSEPATLMLYLESDSGILTVIAWDKDHETRFAGGSPATAERPFRSGVQYANGIPAGIRTIEITSMSVRRDGPWTLTWTPPTVEGTPVSAAPTAPGVCQDVEPVTVNDLPAGLGGRVAFVEGEQFNLFVSSLDGSERVNLGPGLMPQLSPDGGRVVYHGLDRGLYLREVDGAERTLITGTVQENVFDYMPVWSPDGKQIAFNRSIDYQASIYVMNADGTAPTMVVSEPGAPNVLGWSPDGGQIVYWVSSDVSVIVRKMDLASGESRAVATLPLSMDGWQISLSPDATRIAYVNNQGVFLYRLDGSEPVLLHSDANLFISPVWSPDSQWILMAYLDGTHDAVPPHVLIQPETCQMLRLDAPLGSSVSSWVGD